MIPEFYRCPRKISREIRQLPRCLFFGQTGETLTDLLGKSPAAAIFSPDFSTGIVDRIPLDFACGPGSAEENQADERDERPRIRRAEHAPQGFDEDGAAPAPERRGHAVIRDYLRRLDERPGRLPDARRARRRALRRQGPQPPEAGGRLCQADRPQLAHRANDRRHRVDDVPDDRDRDRGAAARAEPDQAAEAALQRAAPRRQELPQHHRHRRPSASRRSRSTAACARSRAATSGRSPRPAASTGR